MYFPKMNRHQMISEVSSLGTQCERSKDYIAKSSFSSPGSCWLTIMFKLLVSTFLLAFAQGIHAAPQASGGTTTDPPAGFAITSFGVNGSGCPPGSVFYLLNGENTAVTVTYSKYFAEVGPGIPISSNRKNCQLTFGISIPPGFSFGVVNADFRGYYQLDSKVTAVQDSLYYFQGNLNQATTYNTLVGPVDGADYTYRSPFNLTFTNLSPCGTDAVLNIESDLHASNADNNKGSGYIATDSTDASFVQTFNFQWQTCT
ncbi:hypothetical protein BDZ97DRAFT_1796418 [Flammula alnicola]|nr:hypothetical protein BDZ97DRAFT_1796418 [Flammula alnicola]